MVILILKLTWWTNTGKPLQQQMDYGKQAIAITMDGTGTDVGRTDGAHSLSWFASHL